jgi:hypothetical protein
MPVHTGITNQANCLKSRQGWDYGAAVPTGRVREADGLTPAADGPL